MTSLGHNKSLLFTRDIPEYVIGLLMCLFTIYMWKMNYVCLFVWNKSNTDLGLKQIMQVKRCLSKYIYWCAFKYKWITEHASKISWITIKMHFEHLLRKHWEMGVPDAAVEVFPLGTWKTKFFGSKTTAKTSAFRAQNKICVLVRPVKTKNVT